MKNFIASVVTVAAVASGALGQAFQVNTPLNLVQCVPTQVSWVGGTPPYTLLIQTPDANGAIIEQHSGLTSTTYTWGTNFSANQDVGFTVRDQTGTSAQSGQTLINAGTDSSCLTGASTPSSGAAGSTAAGSSTAGATSSIGVTSAGTSSTSAAPGSSSGTSRPASSGTSSSASTSASATGAANNGALANSAALGMVGVVGAFVAAIIA